MRLFLYLWAVTANALTPLWRQMLRQRLARGKECSGRLREREGIDETPRPAGPLIWLHSASLGETTSILPVLPHLSGAGVSVIITTTTVSAARMLAERLPALDHVGTVQHRFAPLDVPKWVARFLDHWEPDVAAFVESEIWPNTVAACALRSIPLHLINARMSVRSFRRWRRLPNTAAVVLNSFTHIWAQSETDATRFRALGAQHVTAVGNLKFAAPALPSDEATLFRLRERLIGRPLWVAASLHPGEANAIVAAHQKLTAQHKNLVTVIVPRHPEKVAAFISAAKNVTIVCRSKGQFPLETECVWIADTLGELGLFYRLCPIAFIGGSLIPHGGQNPLEAAKLGCATIVGPHTENFADIVATLEGSGALKRIPNSAELGNIVNGLLLDPARRQAMGCAGRNTADQLAELPAYIARVLCKRGTSPGPPPS